jgi:hypothetical protein
MLKPKLRISSIIFTLAIIASSCNLPSAGPSGEEQSPDIMTAVALTVEAESQGDDQANTTLEPPTATAEGGAEETQSTLVTETNTPAPINEPSETPLPCNAAEFVKDVSILDGKKFAPGANFTKTWRLKNAGTCAWTSGYDLVFNGGDAMDGPSAQQLTTTPVEPGETIDISVDLTAPGSAGIYRGNWELRDPSGSIFGIESSPSGVFWVEIEVVTPTKTPTETPFVIITLNPPLITMVFHPTVTINYESRGMVVSGENPQTNANNVGDTSTNKGRQGFITFNLSEIPDGATILSARLIPISADTIGEPFNDLGYLRVYVDNYGTLNSSDYTPPPVTGAINRFSSFSKMMNDSGEQTISQIGINGIKAALGSNKFQIRLQFNDRETNSDNEADVVRGNFKLVVTYSNP